MGNHFDHASHRYFIDGIEVPSVTRVLKPLGFAYPDGDYAERGSKVHWVTQLIDLGFGLDEAIECLPDEWQDICRPYVYAYGHFKRDVQPEVLGMEKQVYSPKLRVAGTLDRKIRIGNRRGILDIKSGTTPVTVGPQTAGYDWLEHGNIPDPSDIGRCRWSLNLTAEAKYKLDRCDKPNDYLVFLNAVQEWWKNERTQAYGIAV